MNTYDIKIFLKRLLTLFPIRVGINFGRVPPRNSHRWNFSIYFEYRSFEEIKFIWKSTGVKVQCDQCKKVFYWKYAPPGSYLSTRGVGCGCVPLREIQGRGG